MINKTDHDRLKEIREEMMDLLREAVSIIRVADKHIYDRSKAYWIGNIDIGLGDGDYIDAYQFTMDKAIKELDPGEEDNEENEET